MMYSNHDTFDDTFILEKFISVGEKYSAEINEFVLYADKHVVLDRLSKRPYNENDLNTPEKINKHWERMNLFKDTRQNASLIDTTNLTQELVLGKVTGLINKL